MKAKRLRHIVMTLIGAALVGYFLYHTVQGDRGLFAMLRMQGQLAQSEDTLRNLKSDREEMERRVQQLRPKSIDADLLDQEARRSLNFSKNKEIIILSPEKSDQK